MGTRVLPGLGGICKMPTSPVVARGGTRADFHVRAQARGSPHWGRVKAKEKDTRKFLAPLSYAPTGGRPWAAWGQISKSVV